MMESWISEQSKFNVSQFDKRISECYPASKNYFNDPVKYYKGLTEEWNYLDAVKMVKWDLYLKGGKTALDIGGGTGWLSAFISRFDSVEKISLIDSNRDTLSNMAPEIIRLMNGRPEKIALIEGLFSPILIKDESVDMVFICSSLHHADNMVILLKEVNRVLKQGGMFFILNETPYSRTKFLSEITKYFLITVRDIALKKFKPLAASISSSGFLYDPYLTDRAYPFWYFKKALEFSGFSLVEVIDTGLPTLKGEKGLSLVHFISRKK